MLYNPYLICDILLYDIILSTFFLNQEPISFNNTSFIKVSDDNSFLWKESKQVAEISVRYYSDKIDRIHNNYQQTNREIQLWLDLKKTEISTKISNINTT